MTQVPNMTTRNMLWGMTWRGTVGGAIAGLILGAIYGAALAVYALASDSFLFGARSNELLIGNIVLIGIGGFAGSLVGLVMGSFLGLIGGISLALFTRLLFAGKTSPSYVTIVRLAGLIFGIIGAPLVFMGFEILRTALFGGRWTFSITLLYHIVPALIGGFAAMFVSGRIARWYENEVQKKSS